MVGIDNVTIITQADITSFGNVSGMSELMIRISNDVYGGMLYFILLFVLWIILFFALQDRDDQPFINIMYSGAGVTIVAMILRAVIVYQDGIERGLLSDAQLWVFPIITIILAMFNYFNKD